jgi:hypothetical protein
LETEDETRSEKKSPSLNMNTLEVKLITSRMRHGHFVRINETHEESERRLGTRKLKGKDPEE